jgi:hypothetical protein
MDANRMKKLTTKTQRPRSETTRKVLEVSGSSVSLWLILSLFASIRGLSDEASVLGFCLPACWRSRIHSRFLSFICVHLRLNSLLAWKEVCYVA